MRVSLARRLTPAWLSSVELVRSVYARAFEAQVMPDPDYFIVAEGVAPEPGAGGDGPAVAACAGVTVPRGQPFFSECYLDRPVDEIVAERLGVEARRDRIVEIGPLASGVTRAGREVVRLTPIIAWCMGMEHILCTVTGSLAALLERTGIVFVPFADAQAARLAEADRGRWGRYYDEQPRVGVIPLDQLSELFAQVTGQYRFIDLDLGLPLGEAGDTEVLCHAAD